MGKDYITLSKIPTIWPLIWLEREEEGVGKVVTDQLRFEKTRLGNMENRRREETCFLDSPKIHWM